mmetsp:Transcript_50400/g.100250  ORF Transcript_50400/g.100250 Transcript_50400/m.100250 type:complete len:106 (-) Transcript_50400:3417-3734(-)
MSVMLLRMTSHLPLPFSHHLPRPTAAVPIVNEEDAGLHDPHSAVMPARTGQALSGPVCVLYTSLHHDAFWAPCFSPLALILEEVLYKVGLHRKALRCRLSMAHWR